MEPVKVDPLVVEKFDADSLASFSILGKRLVPEEGKACAPTLIMFVLKNFIMSQHVDAAEVLHKACAFIISAVNKRWVWLRTHRNRKSDYPPSFPSELRYL